MTPPLLSVENLVVEYPVKNGVYRAVDDVSFTVDQGQTLAVVGESGCGKSTIARSLVRLLKPTSGKIKLDGVDIAGMRERELRPLRSKIQMVFQDPYGSLDPHQTAQEIVGEPLRQRGVTSRNDRHKERIGIARALASQPELLVADEPTSALDVSVQAQVLRLLGELQETTGVTYLFISHNLGVVREISEQVMVMSKGRIVESGPTSQVLASPAEAYTRTLRAAALDPSTIHGRKPRAVLRTAERVA
jgi:peptide/nickel transport system ATP-binding protein